MNFPLQVDTSIAQSSPQDIVMGSVAGRALELLGSGVPQEAVASALGVSPSYISQLLSDADFASKVTEKKYSLLSKHTERDAAYDLLEDDLIEKLNKAKNLMFRPADILAAIKVINGAKRRGTDSQASIVTQQNIVEITMPTQIIQQFTTNIVNQVVKVGDKDLITIQSGDLLKTVAPEESLPHPQAQAQIEESPKSEPNHQPKPLDLLENNTLLDSL